MAGAIVGAEGLDDLGPFCAPELRELFHGMDRTLQDGTPHQIPAAIPLGQLGRIVLTLKRYRQVAEQLVAESNKANVVDGPAPDYAAVVKVASELLTVGPPIAKPPPRSRLVLPS